MSRGSQMLDSIDSSKLGGASEGSTSWFLIAEGLFTCQLNNLIQKNVEKNQFVPYAIPAM